VEEVEVVAMCCAAVVASFLNGIIPSTSILFLFFLFLFAVLLAVAVVPSLLAALSAFRRGVCAEFEFEFDASGRGFGSIDRSIDRFVRTEMGVCGRYGCLIEVMKWNRIESNRMDVLIIAVLCLGVMVMGSCVDAESVDGFCEREREREREREVRK
jgi:hypothetical protein